MTQLERQKVSGKFYPLQHDEWLQTAKVLTYSELLVLYHLRTYEPFGDRLTEIKTKSIADALSISQRTVQRAILKLHELELIDLEIKSFGFRLRTQHATPMSPSDTHVASVTPMSPQRHPCRLSDTHVASVTPMSRSQSETFTQSEFCSSQTIQTYSDFIQTLSDSERENFEKFVREEWKRITTRNGEPGEEIVSLERFLAREEDLQNWHQRFLKSPAGKVAKKEAIASTHDWRSDPRFDSWIWEAFNRGYEWIHENEAEREQRRTFCDWAHQVDAYEVCVKAIYGSEEVGA